MARMNRPTSCLAVLALLLSACASRPSAPDTLPALPQGWHGAPALAADSTSDLRRWWDYFKDPQLSALIEQALQANASVNSAQAALQQARASRELREAGLSPSLGLALSAQRSRSGRNASSNSLAASLDASWEPDLFGQTRAQIDAAAADGRAAAYSLAQVQAALAAELGLAYVELRGLQLRRQLAAATLAAQQDTLQITRWRLAAGLASSLQQAQAEAAYEQTRAQLPALDTAIGQTLHALAVLSGQPPAALRDGRLDMAQARIPQPDLDLALAFPTATLAQRPDVGAAAARAEAARAGLAQAEGLRYPSLRLSGSLGLRALSLAALDSGASLAQSVLASLALPLLDGGATAAQQRIALAGVAQADAAYRGTLLQALQDVEDALLGLQGERARLARLEAAAAAAAQAEGLARQRYRSGLIDFATVLDTQRSLLASQDSLAGSRASLAAQHIQLYKALGGGWTPEPVNP